MIRCSTFSSIIVNVVNVMLVVAVGLPADAQIVSVERVAFGLDRPVFLTAAPGDAERVFILEQHTGQIRILHRSTGLVDPIPFLTISGLATGGEQGLLGLAFHPGYADNGFLYVDLTTPNTEIRRYRVSLADPDLADPGSQTPILDFVQPAANHNGGWLGFGPDGFLYVATGDGGGANDSGAGHTAGIGNAQDLDNLLGAILRIDVDGDDFPADPDRNYAIPVSNPFVDIAGSDEIWAYGLRNPWRPSFDRSTGDLYIADVGQNACEEINLQLADSMGGENYGWRLREGVIATPSGGVGGARPTGAIDPFLVYPHGVAASCSSPSPGFLGFSVTGGYAYRGPVASLHGRYFFGDFFEARIRSLIVDGSHPTTHDGTNFQDLVDHSLDPEFDPDLGVIGSLASFGEDSDGNLYVLDLDGEIFRVPEPDPVPLAMLALGVVGVVAWSRGWRPIP